MTDLESSLYIIRQAEAALRALMERALHDQRYGDVMTVAPLAEALATLLGNRSDVSTSVEVSVASVPKHPSAVKRAAGKNTAHGDAYPQFRNDAGKLVKIGWSKKDRREYEHRIPFEAVLLVASVLAQSVSASEVFTMEQVLPVRDEDGKNLPSYQTYLALAWFRACGVVETRGKEGYVFTKGSLDKSNIQRMWKDLRTK